MGTLIGRSGNLPDFPDRPAQARRDGRIERGVSVYLPEDRHLSAAEARDLAAKLVEAATMLEGLQ